MVFGFRRPIHPAIQQKQQWIHVCDGFNMQYERPGIIYEYYDGMYSGNVNGVTVLQR